MAKQQSVWQRRRKAKMVVHSGADGGKYKMLRVLASMVALVPALSSLPTVDVPRCPHYGKANGFSLIGDGDTSTTPQQTDAELCWNETHLDLRWTAFSRQVISNYTQCHDTVWMADAVEFYISPGAISSTNYTEIDSSPMGGMWLGRIVNPSGYNPGPASYVNLPECNTSGIQLTTSITQEAYSAHLAIPFSFLLGSATKDIPKQWRANFYRWNEVPRNLTAWSPTSCDGVSPCNAPHVPKYFGHLKLVEDKASGLNGALHALQSMFDLRTDKI
jgi:hypothetical protein